MSVDAPRTAAAPLQGLVRWEPGGDAVLLGGRCPACATHTFPRAGSCPRCGRRDPEEVALPRTGTLWTWTVQRLAPKPPFRAPEPFEPFALGYVDLGPVRVEARLAGRAVDGWTIGDRVSLAVEPLPGEDPGDSDARWCFVFRPIEDGG
jgi:uncharacterized OB-fold protein